MMQYDQAAVRQFLMELFTDEELTILCADFFPEVYDNFAAGLNKGQKIQLLLDYCRRNKRTDHLLAALRRERPEPFERRFPSAPAVASRPRTPAQRNPRQIFVSYAYEDGEFAHRLAGDLRQEGWTVWIAPGSIRPAQTLPGIRSCVGVVGTTQPGMYGLPSATPLHLISRLITWVFGVGVGRVGNVGLMFLSCCGGRCTLSPNPSPSEGEGNGRPNSIGHSLDY